MSFKTGDRVTTHRIMHGPGKGGFFPGPRITGTVVSQNRDFVVLKDVLGYKLEPGEKPEFWKSPFTKVLKRDVAQG